MVQLKEAMARIRLVLVEISSREEQMDAMIGQFRTQLERLPKQAVYGNAGLELALSAMEEVRERLSHSFKMSGGTFRPSSRKRQTS